MIKSKLKYDIEIVKYILEIKNKTNNKTEAVRIVKRDKNIKKLEKK